MIDINFTNKSMLIISTLKEDRIHEAFEYALELLKKDIDSGNASKYFLKDFVNAKTFNFKINENNINIEEIKYNEKEIITEVEKNVYNEINLDKNQTIKEEIKKEFKIVENIKNFEENKFIEEEKIEIKGFLDLSEF